MENYKAYVAVILLQVILAGMVLFTKAAVDVGINPMKPSVFVFYRQAFATLSISPFAFFLERKMSTAQLSFRLLCKLFMVSFIGITLTFNLYSNGLKYATASMAAASHCMVPVLTFLWALTLRIESISLKKRHGWAKVLGSILCLSGAFVYAFVKGSTLYSSSYSHQPNQSQNMGPTISSTGQMIKGFLLLVASMTAWSLWIVLQALLMKEYPAKLRLIALQSAFSCIQASTWAIILERNVSSWKLGWNLNLLSVIYCGVVVTGVSFWLRLYATQKKGPVFAALFSPLTLIMTLAVSASIWHEAIHIGSICGAILLVIGLYSVLWGKNKEDEQQKLVTNARNSDTVKDVYSDSKAEKTLECIIR